MPAFEYKALNPGGREQRGVVEGDTPRQARQALRERGLQPLDITTITEGKQQGGMKHRFNQGLSSTELALMTRQLSTLVRSGIPLEEALGTAARQNDKPRVKRIIMGVRTRVTEGHALEAGLRDFPGAFPELYSATVAAGEKSGHLDTVLDRLADYAEKRQDMQQRLSMALIYPIILTTIAFLVVIGLLTYVVPQVVEVFENLGQELPLLTRSLIAISDFTKSYGLLILIALVIAVVLFARMLRSDTFRYRVHNGLLTLPLLSRLIKGVNTARFARTLSILVASSVPVLDALRISAQVVRNLPMREAIMNASASVREGASINAALESSKLFPPMTLHLIASGESSGKLEIMLERAADQQERELQTLLGTLLALFEPIMILTMGILVLLIVLAILLPIFELNQLVK